MALDDVVQKVILEGDDQIISAFDRILEKADRTFEEIHAAAEHGNSGLEQFGLGLAGLVGVVSTVTAALTSFVQSQNETVVNLAALGSSFGATITQIYGMEGAFAAGGVSSQNMARLIQRSTREIATNWSQISREIREGATAQEASRESIVSANIRIEEAENNLSNGSRDRRDRMEADNIAVAQTYQKLSEVSAETSATMTHDMQSVAGASLSLETAEQRLATLQGRPPSDSEKQQLAIKEAELAVDKAKQAQQDAARKQLEDMQGIQLKQREAALAYENAQRKRAEDNQKALIEEQQQVLAVAQAHNALAEAQNKAYDLSLKSLPDIAKGLANIETGTGGVVNGIKLADVATHDLVKGFELLASSGGKMPTGFEMITKLADTFHADTGRIISDQQRLAIAQQLSGGSGGGLNAYLPELVSVLNKGADAWRQFQKTAEDAGLVLGSTDLEAAEEFRAAMETLAVHLDLVKNKLATMASPALTEFLKNLDSSLLSSGGLLHEFASGIQAIGQAIGAVAELVVSLASKFDKLAGLDPGTTLKIGFVALAATIAGALAAVDSIVLKTTAWAIIIGLVVLAAGSLVDLFNRLNGTADQTVSKLTKIGDLIVKAGAMGALGSAQSAADITGHAEGGPIKGPGTQTSDSILARLSSGEFVIKAKAVQAYGQDLFHSLNSMTFPGFAMGGLVTAPVRMASGGPVKAGSTLNLSIDGESFNGLHAPPDVAEKLQSYAISRQTSSTGRQPSWVK